MKAPRSPPHFVLQVHVERIACAASRNHARRHGKHHGILDVGRQLINAADDRLHLFRALRALVPVLQPYDEHAGGGALASDQAVARCGHEVVQFGHLPQPLADAEHDLIDAGHVGRLVAHVEARLHRLDHHDGVVHHRTDDQHQSK